MIKSKWFQPLVIIGW